MTDLEITDLAKSFGPLVVLRDLNLAVPPGSFTSILGALFCFLCSVFLLAVRIPCPLIPRVSIGR